MPLFCVTVQYHNFIVFSRLISRVALIPFSVSASGENGVSAAERRKLDKDFNEAMELAASAAELVVKIGLEFKKEHELDAILQKVEKLLPEDGQALQRITTSYAWLLFATENY